MYAQRPVGAVAGYHREVVRLVAALQLDVRLLVRAPLDGGVLGGVKVEAVVEAGRVASEGARSIGQEVVSSSRDGVEKAADAIRSLAEAKSPTEYLQLQSDFARQSFDRVVAESSKLTESLVKLAGEAFQPLSNRATANAERFNTLVA